MAGAIAVAIVSPAYNPPLLTETQNFEKTLLGPLQIPRNILSNLALNGYSTLSELAYFGHNYFEEFCPAKIIQALNRDGNNYINKFIKSLQGLVWIESDIKRLHQPLLIDTNITRDEADEWYFEWVVEVKN